jgi:hypothetical protein
MQACTPLPPPPGALGADSLGLADPPVLAGVVTLAVETCWANWGESGAIAGSCVIGAAIWETGAGAVVWVEVVVEVPPPPPPALALRPVDLPLEVPDEEPET